MNCLFFLNVSIFQERTGEIKSKTCSIYVYNHFYDETKIWSIDHLVVYPVSRLAVNKFSAHFPLSVIIRPKYSAVIRDPYSALAIIRTVRKNGKDYVHYALIPLALVDRLQLSFWMVRLLLTETRVELGATPSRLWILFPTDSIISFLSISWIICSPIHAFTRTQNYLIYAHWSLQIRQTII